MFGGVELRLKLSHQLRLAGYHTGKLLAIRGFLSNLPLTVNHSNSIFIISASTLLCLMEVVVLGLHL